jgi:uncharacterized protein
MERYRIALSGGHLAVALHRPARGPVAPCVVACHGLSASKDSDKYLLLAEELPRAGLALARFDFRGCGESSGVEEDTTVASRIEDVQAVLKLLEADAGLDAGRLGLLGSSLGGFVALHVAALRGDGMPVVTWNAPANLDDLAHEARHDGAGLGPAFFAELATHRHVRAPAGVPRHLIVQGERDDVVPIEHATVLADRAGDPFDCVVIPDADHRLTDIAHRREALRVSVAWFSRFLLR